MNLRWNSSEYGGVRDLRIPPHRLWKPDVLMYNRWVILYFVFYFVKNNCYNYKENIIVFTAFKFIKIIPNRDKLFG